MSSSDKSDPKESKPKQNRSSMTLQIERDCQVTEKELFFYETLNEKDQIRIFLPEPELP